MRKDVTKAIAGAAVLSGLVAVGVACAININNLAFVFLGMMIAVTGGYVLAFVGGAASEVLRTIRKQRANKNPSNPRRHLGPTF